MRPLDEAPYDPPLVRFVLPPVLGAQVAQVTVRGVALGPAPLDGVSTAFDVGFDAGGPVEITAGDMPVAEFERLSLHLAHATVTLVEDPADDRHRVQLVSSRSRLPFGVSIKGVVTGLAEARVAVAPVDCRSNREVDESVNLHWTGR